MVSSREHSSAMHLLAYLSKHIAKHIAGGQRSKENIEIVTNAIRFVAGCRTPCSVEGSFRWFSMHRESGRTRCARVCCTDTYATLAMILGNAKTLEVGGVSTSFTKTVNFRIPCTWHVIKTLSHESVKLFGHGFTRAIIFSHLAVPLRRPVRRVCDKGVTSD